MNHTYPSPLNGWKVLRLFSICDVWQPVVESHELDARKVYDAHKRTLGKGKLCLVGPDGRVVEGGAA